jgi:hypothetical protein
LLRLFHKLYVHGYSKIMAPKMMILEPSLYVPIIACIKVFRLRLITACGDNVVVESDGTKETSDASCGGGDNAFVSSSR